MSQKKHFTLITRGKPLVAQNILDCLVQFLIDIILMSETFKTTIATTVDTYF